MGPTSVYIRAINQQMKKYSEATQTRRAGCSKADPQTDRVDYNTLRSLARSVKIHRKSGTHLRRKRVITATE